MGLCASQGRLLMLTARKSDLELQAQFISQRRIMLSQKTLSITETYNSAISNKKVVMSQHDTTGTTWLDLATNIDHFKEEGYTFMMADENGDLQTVNINNFNNQQLQSYLQSGKLQIKNTNTNEMINYSTDETSTFREVLDESDDDVAQAEYETAMARIQAQDKMLELQLKNIETEHKAVETEYDSVKKVIQKNIEVSFKTFS